MEDLAALFGPVGITSDEAAVYGHLLEHPGSSVADLAVLASLPRRRIEVTLSDLEAKGLVSRRTGRPPAFVPAPPDVAIEVLILRRQEELERSRLAARELARHLRSSDTTVGPMEVVEVIVGLEPVGQRFMQLQEAATASIKLFDKPPYAVSGRANEDTELRALRRGVEVRVVYDRASVEAPGGPDHIQDGITAGESARVFSPVPLKMVIVDERLALLPLSLEQPGQPGALLLHPSPLLAALNTLFEMVWSAGVPFAAGSPADTSRFTGDELEVLTMLAAGLKDEAIARQTGVALSTVARRVRRVLDELGAKTRFQAGLQAARRDLIR